MTNPVFRSFGVSILIHLLLFGMFLVTQMVGFERLPFFPIFKAMQEFLMPAPIPQAVKKQQPELTLTFIEVDPTLAVKEPPPDAKFYSAVSTEAANLTIKKESDVPNVDGKQKETLKLTENTPSRALPLQPSPKPEKPAEQTESARPKPQQEIGDLALAKPQEKAKKDSGEADSEKGESDSAKRERPRTLAEAKKGLRGEKSQVEGGIPRLDSNSLAARGTVLGDYDARFVDAVRQCWFDLLEPRTTGRVGKVVVEFHLHYDGRVSEVRVVENHCGEMESLFCETAITKPAPFEKWPNELRRELKGDTREVRFTFYYE